MKISGNCVCFFLATCIGPMALGLGHDRDSEKDIQSGIQGPGLGPRQLGLGIPAELFVDTVLSLYRTQIQLLGLDSFRVPKPLIPGPLAKFNVGELHVHGIGNIARYGPITTQIGLFSSSLASGMELKNIGANFSYGSTDDIGGNIHYNCPSITIEAKFAFSAAIPFPKIGLENFHLNTSSCGGMASDGEDSILSTTIVILINAGQESLATLLNEQIVRIFGDVLGNAAQVVFG